MATRYDDKTGLGLAGVRGLGLAGLLVLASCSTELPPLEPITPCGGEPRDAFTLRLATGAKDGVYQYIGPLFRRLIRHRKGCPKCERGEGHPVWVLSISYRGGKNKQISLSAEQRRQVELWTENYRRLKAGLEAISEINHRLLRSDE